MNAQDDDGQGALWPALFGVLLLVVGLVVGLVMGRDIEQNVASHVQPVTAAQPATSAVNQAHVTEEEGVVKFYFAHASAVLAPGAQEELGTVVKGVAAGQKAVISGFGGGDPTQDQDLTRQRILAVRGALASLGIGDDKMELAPFDPAVVGSAGVARVEVRLE
jgi:K(+)-stimulated pyrophosphate-energized sodium pump